MRVATAASRCTTPDHLRRSDDHRLVFTAEEFDAYLTGAREDLALEITRREDGMYLFRRSSWASAELEFTEAEVAAFLAGIAKHEFDAIAYAA